MSDTLRRVELILGALLVVALGLLPVVLLRAPQCAAELRAVFLPAVRPSP